MSEAEVNAGPPPTVDIQDPLPEGTFFYRRVFSYGISVALVALLALVVWRMDSASELKQVALYICLLLFAVITYYMVAPSAEQVVKMLQTAKMFIHGVTVQSTASASDGRRSAQSRTTVRRESRQERPETGAGARKGPSAGQHTRQDEDGPPWAGNQE